MQQQPKRDYNTENVENRYITVVGNFGSGQEIIIKFLKKHFKRLKVVNKLNFPGMNFLSQIESLGRIFKIMDNNKKFFRNQLFICDNSPLFIQNCILPALHSLGKLTPKEVNVFREWVRLVGLQSTDCLIIYLKLDTNKCFERVLNHKIISDVTSGGNIIDFDFLMEMQRQLTHWVENGNINEEHLIIDMNKYLELEFDERLEKELLRQLIKEFPFLESAI
jgi:hypothetical protein